MSRPLIGLATGLNKEETYLTINNCYMRSLEAAGAMPVVLPLTDDESLLADYLARVDGLLLTGGGDLDPASYGEQTLPACGTIDTLRDAMELPLARMAAKRPDLPMLAICRGAQVLNVALGGSLYQDLPSQTEARIAHRQKQPDRFPAHPVAVTPGSLLAKIAGAEAFAVNSLHHQAVREPAPALHVCAASPDGVIEAVELPEHPFYLGVQWHPERMWQNDDISMKIFRAFVDACRNRT